jgi:membrane protease YdiL (CAAX protease family)
MKSKDGPMAGLHPLAEAAAVFCLLYLPRSLTLHPENGGYFMPAYRLALFLELAAGGGLLALFMARRHGMRLFFPGTTRVLPDPLDLARGLAVAVAMAVATLLPLAISRFAGWSNPLAAVGSGSMTDPAIAIPLLALSSLALGYSEELFFRVYAFGMLRKSGLSVSAAAVSSCLVFAGAHSGQGTGGILAALCAGLILQLVWIAKRNFHSIAFGHACYDFCVLMIFLYGGTGNGA